MNKQVFPFIFSVFFLAFMLFYSAKAIAEVRLAKSCNLTCLLPEIKDNVYVCKVYGCLEDVLSSAVKNRNSSNSSACVLLGLASRPHSHKYCWSSYGGK